MDKICKIEKERGGGEEMEIRIEGTPKEIAALVLAVQERRDRLVVDLDTSKCDPYDLIKKYGKCTKEHCLA